MLMDAVTELRTAADRAEKAMAALMDAIHNHPDSEALAAAEAAAADVAAGLNKAAEAAEGVVAAMTVPSAGSAPVAPSA